MSPVGLLALLLKCVEHIDRTGEVGDVYDSPLPQHVNADLFHPGANDLHRSPVSWLQSALHGIRFEMVSLPPLVVVPDQRMTFLSIREPLLVWVLALGQRFRQFTDDGLNDGAVIQDHLSIDKYPCLWLHWGITQPNLGIVKMYDAQSTAKGPSSPLT